MLSKLTNKNKEIKKLCSKDIEIKGNRVENVVGILSGDHGMRSTDENEERCGTDEERMVNGAGSVSSRRLLGLPPKG